MEVVNILLEVMDLALKVVSKPGQAIDLFPLVTNPLVPALGVLI
jgi:hypothetical protein